VIGAELRQTADTQESIDDERGSTISIGTPTRLGRSATSAISVVSNHRTELQLRTWCNASGGAG